MIGRDVQKQEAESSGMELFTMPTMVKPRQNSRTSAFARIVDIALASVILFLLCPLLVVIAIAIRLQSPGPVLVRQSRTGLYVFRTTAGSDGGTAWLDRFLRQSSLDELPQLLSVVSGHLSLVNCLSPCWSSRET